MLGYRIPTRTEPTTKRARKPRLLSRRCNLSRGGGDGIAGEAEVGEQRGGGGGLAEGVEADDSTTRVVERADVGVPAGGGAGFDGHAWDSRRQHTVPPGLILALEHAGGRQRHYARGDALGGEGRARTHREGHLGAGGEQHHAARELGGEVGEHVAATGDVLALRLIARLEGHVLAGEDQRRRPIRAGKGRPPRPPRLRAV